MATMNFGGVSEQVVTREEFSLERAKDVLKDTCISVLGYGVQGPAQALNLRDQGFNVVVGQRKGTKTWDKAVLDGWKPGETLFELEEAAQKGSVWLFLLSDAGQIELWPKLKPYLTNGKTLCFSHGFGLTYNDQTNIQPPSNVDVVLVAPKGSGTSVRRHFLEGKGINASYAVDQDYTGKAWDKAVALGMGVGAGYLFETSFKKEVYSDLTGERGVLMGALAGMMEAQYNVLRANGHSPSEAFNETVEELTQSLMPLVAENGMDWMFANTSTTAQRGALDWRHRFRDASMPIFMDLYDKVASGEEARITIDANKSNDYRVGLEKELSEIAQSEMWQAGKQVRSLRPENSKGFAEKFKMDPVLNN